MLSSSLCSLARNHRKMNAVRSYFLVQKYQWISVWEKRDAGYQGYNFRDFHAVIDPRDTKSPFAIMNSSWTAKTSAKSFPSIFGGTHPPQLTHSVGYESYQTASKHGLRDCPALLLNLKLCFYRESWVYADRREVYLLISHSSLSC